MTERRGCVVDVNGTRVALEAWPEYGAWFEVGHTDPITGGKVGSLYAPMYSNGSPPTGDDVGEIEYAIEDIADERTVVEIHRAVCIANGTHHVPDDASFDGVSCVVCDTQECGDCSRPCYWSEEAGDYRHIEVVNAPPCFLIQVSS